MIDITDKLKCSGCYACANVCPVRAIKMEADNEGFWYPKVDYDTCIKCNKCNSVCPYINSVIPENDEEICYIAYSKDEIARSISSSGGIFITLARYIIDNGGVVFGAAYDDFFLAYHRSAETYNELKDLVGSKYMQSRIGESYKKVQLYLNSDRKVLFVGTTCQIAGLKSFLKEEYENLLTVDFICLGVPSPKVWNDYLNTFFRFNEVNYVNFKDKTHGWHNFSLMIKDNKTHVKIGKNTFFFSGYFKQLYSRPSCSNCLFKGKNRVSDITISDCWGCEVTAPEMDDNKGLSSVECHSHKGILYFERIKEWLYWKETNIENVKKYNSNYCKSAYYGEKRTEFWEQYDKIPKEKLFRKYCKPENDNVIKKIINKIIKRYGS